MSALSKHSPLSNSQGRSSTIEEGFWYRKFTRLPHRGQTLRIVYKKCATLDFTSAMGTRQLHKSSQVRNATVRKLTIDRVAIGRRIRHIRGAALTQENFARVLGVGQTQLSRYELGQSVPTLNILLRLKIYSRKSVDWILLGEEPERNH